MWESLGESDLPADQKHPVYSSNEGNEHIQPSHRSRLSHLWSVRELIQQTRHALTQCWVNGGPASKTLGQH